MSTATYRFVHFSSEPWTGMRWPVAALVQSGDKLAVVRAPHVPGADCLGGGAFAALLRLVLGRLHGVTEFSHLPISLGPHVTLDAPRVIPNGVQDHLKWVENALPAKAIQHDDGRTRQPARYVHGQRFLETYRVAKYVHRNFDAAQYLGVTLSPITQWVIGNKAKSAMLLMEPLVVTREKFETELVEIATKFSAYKGEIARMKVPPDRVVQFIAYLLPSESRKQKEAAFEILRNKADEIVDTSFLPPRTWLIDRIKAVAEASKDLILDQ